MTQLILVVGEFKNTFNFINTLITNNRSFIDPSINQKLRESSYLLAHLTQILSIFNANEHNRKKEV